GAARGVLADPPRLGGGTLLDLAGALLRGLHDLANLFGGGTRYAGGRGLELGLQLRDCVGELAQVEVDLLLVVAAPRDREVLALDVVTIQLHASSRPRSGHQRSGRNPRRSATALAAQQAAETPHSEAHGTYE